MGHLPGAEKLFFLIRDIDGPATAAAPVGQLSSSFATQICALAYVLNERIRRERGVDVLFFTATVQNLRPDLRFRTYNKRGSRQGQVRHLGSSWPGGGERPPIRYEDSWGGLRGPSDTQLLIYSYIKR